MAQHDVVGARAAVDRLVEVVAHREVVGQALEVRRVPVLHVVEAQCGRAFTGRLGGGRVLGAEVGRLRQAVGAGAHRRLDPGEQGRVAARGAVRRRVLQAAVQLLPHLVEAMHRACRVGVVVEAGGVRQLERTGRQRVDVLDAHVGHLGGLAGAARDQVGVVVVGQSVLGRLGEREAVARDVGVLRAAGQRRGQHALREGRFRRAQQERVAARVGGGLLLRLVEVRAGRAVALDDALGEQVPHRLAAMDGLVGGEDVVEAAVLADDDDDVLDRRSGVAAVVRRRGRGVGGLRGGQGRHDAVGHLGDR